MTNDQKKNLKATIAEQIQRLKAEISDLKISTEPIERDCSLGKLGRTEVMAELQTAHKLLEHSQTKLMQLSHAQVRIDDPSYGQCQLCDDPISYARLLLLPEAMLCIDCANERGD